MLGLPGLNKAA